MLQLAQKLEYKTPLKVVKAKKYFYPEKQRAFAVLYLPAVTLLKSMSVDEVLKHSKKKIKETASDSQQLISIAIDRWEYQNTKLLTFLYRLFDLPDACLIPVGPSTGETLKAVNSESELRRFLNVISNCGINSIEGGNDPICLEIADEQKFILRPSFAVNINQGFTDSLAEKISKIEYLSRSSNRVETLTVFPHQRFIEFESPALKARSIQKYLNILKNSRKYAPSLPYLRAPISAFGNVLPEELAIPEVNDFGHFAINQETAVALGLEQLNQNYKSLFL